MKIFITGASGYIGGAVARRLATAGHQLTGLVRRPDAAHDLERHGITPIAGTLDDADRLAAAARAADAVVHTAHADHPGSVDTFIQALAGSGKPFIHTSGSSLVGDRANGEPSDRLFAEDTPLVPEPEMQARIVLNQRVVDGAGRGIRSVVIVPSMVYGGGGSVQLPRLIEQSKTAGAGVQIGRGLNRWSNVHMDDLADLYLLALERAEAGDTYYAGVGEAALGDIAAAISRMLGFGGATVSWTIAQASEVWGARMAALALGNNSRVSSEKARRQLGWQPHRADLLSDVEHGSYAERHRARLA